MKDRLITLACALGALALFVAMFMRGEGGFPGHGNAPRPTSQERRGNGYHAAMAWLDEEHIRTVSLRDRFNKLADRPGLPPTGNLLIVTLPAATAFKTDEFRPLDTWVRAGNTLLVLAALSDNPDWAFALGGLASGDLNLLTGLEFETVASRDRRARAPLRPAKHGSAARPAVAPKGGNAGPRIEAASSAFAQPQRGTLIPNRPHAYFDGVRAAVALSDYPSQAWTVEIPYDGFVLSLASERETGEGVLWTRPLGNGRVIVSGLGSLFTNRALGLADNARLLANIVGATVDAGGAVLLDDLHQGFGAAYDPEKFYKDRRLYATAGILAGLWLCWVLGSTRLQIPVTGTSAPREAELVRATGGFLARVLSSDAGARGLFEHFFRRVGERQPLSREKGRPPWGFLEGHPGVARADIRQLRDWYADAHAARRVPLGRLHNLIIRIDRQVTL
jgi:Domain of unknown function (DUF4350)